MDRAMKREERKYFTITEKTKIRSLHFIPNDLLVQSELCFEGRGIFQILKCAYSSPRVDKGMRVRLDDQPFEGYFIGLTDGCPEEYCLMIFPCLSWLSILLENIWFGSGSTMFLSRPELMHSSTLPFKIRKKAFSEREVTETFQIHFNNTCQ